MKPKTPRRKTSESKQIKDYNDFLNHCSRHPSAKTYKMFKGMPLCRECYDERTNLRCVNHPRRKSFTADGFCKECWDRSIRFVNSVTNKLKRRRFQAYRARTTYNPDGIRVSFTGTEIPKK